MKMAHSYRIVLVHFKHFRTAFIHLIPHVCLLYTFVKFNHHAQWVFKTSILQADQQNFYKRNISNEVRKHDTSLSSTMNSPNKHNNFTVSYVKGFILSWHANICLIKILKQLNKQQKLKRLLFTLNNLSFIWTPKIIISLISFHTLSKLIANYLRIV